MQQGHNKAGPLHILSLSFFPVAEPGFQSGPSYTPQPYDATHPEVPAVHPPAAGMPGSQRACACHMCLSQGQEGWDLEGAPSLNNCRPSLWLQIDGLHLELVTSLLLSRDSRAQSPAATVTVETKRGH